MWAFPNLQIVGIEIANQYYDKKYFVNVLEKLPKTLSIELYFRDE